MSPDTSLDQGIELGCKGQSLAHTGFRFLWLNISPSNGRLLFCLRFNGQFFKIYVNMIFIGTDFVVLEFE